LIFIVLVQEAGDPLELGGLPRLAHGNGVIKDLVLDVGRQIIPLPDDRSAQAAQNVLLFLAKRDQGIAAFLRRPLGGTALVVPAGEGLGCARAFADTVGHLRASGLLITQSYDHHLA
jgi:hypothetical protein